MIYLHWLIIEEKYRAIIFTRCSVVTCKGKPAERQGRKAIGLNLEERYDS